MSVLSGRLGLEGAELLHEDRHAFLALRYGRLEVVEGCLRFVTEIETTVIPYQRLSCIVLEPGTSVTHDALRLLARHGVGLIATGLDGAKCYMAPPLLSDSSELARRQARAWADLEVRLSIARQQYAMRFGETPQVKDLDELRGLEGARIREAYRHFAQANGIRWDVPRSVAKGTGDANAALNYAADAIYAASAIAAMLRRLSLSSASFTRSRVAPSSSTLPTCTARHSLFLRRLEHSGAITTAKRTKR